MTLGYGNYTMQEISTAPGYAFVVPNQQNFGVNGVPIPTVGGMTPKSTVPVPAYVPQKDNTGNYIMAGAAATAAIMLGILALKKGKKVNIPPAPPASVPTKEVANVITNEVKKPGLIKNIYQKLQIYTGKIVSKPLVSRFLNIFN